MTFRGGSSYLNHESAITTMAGRHGSLTTSVDDTAFEDYTYADGCTKTSRWHGIVRFFGRKKVCKQGCKLQGMPETPCISGFRPCTLAKNAEILAILATLPYSEITAIRAYLVARQERPATRCFKRVLGRFLQPCNHLLFQFQNRHTLFVFIISTFGDS